MGMEEEVEEEEEGRPLAAGSVGSTAVARPRREAGVTERDETMG